MQTYNSPEPQGPQPDKSSNDTLADQTPRREGGDDALAEIQPNDNRADEKVIVNEQREHKTVNMPSQTATHTSENEGSDEEVDAE